MNFFFLVMNVEKGLNRFLMLYCFTQLLAVCVYIVSVE